MPTSRPIGWGARLFVQALFLVSGATALVYQVAWVRNLTLIFGASFHATSIVLASFMGGLALGGVFFGRRSGKTVRPLRLFGLLELGVAGFALVLPFLLSAVDTFYVTAARAAPGVIPALLVMRVALAFGVLVIPTFFMGGTLPVLTRSLVQRSGELGFRLSWLYGINTLGAVVGAVAAGFFLLPALGVSHTHLIAVAGSLGVGGIAIAIDAVISRAPRSLSPTDPISSADPSSSVPLDGALLWSMRLAFWGTAVSGFCALALEVLWARAITIAVGNTTYSFTVMLAAFLMGIGLGSWLHAAFPLRRVAESTQFGICLVAIGLTSVAATFLVPQLPELALTANFALFDDAVRIRPATVLLVAFSIMLIPCLFMGVAFPLAGQARARLLANVGRSVGDTVGLNTMGSIAGSLAAGFVLIPQIGLQRGMLAVACVDLVYGIIVLAAVRGSRPDGSWVPTGAVAAGLAAIALALPVLTPSWDLTALGAFQNNKISGYINAQGKVDIQPKLNEATVLYYREGRSATISVVEQNGHRQILVNGKVVASEALVDLQIEYLLGHLPALLHENPRSALVVGLGAGITAGGIAAHSSIERLVVVEIEPAVVDGAARFGNLNGDVVHDPNLEIVFQDGRNFLKTTTESFDVISADPIHPWAYGATYLYTTEYYNLARQRLRPGGIMCQWLPATDLSDQDFRSVVASFAENFRYTTLWNTAYDAILIGSDTPIQVDLGRLAERLAEPRVAQQLAAIGLYDPLSFLAEFTLDDAAVRKYTAGAIINTDDNLHLEFSSPLAMGGRASSKNIRSLNRLRVSPRAVIGSIAPLFESEAEAASVFEAYQRAKSTTLEAQHVVARSIDSAEAALSDVLKTLPEYGPAEVKLAAVLAQLGVQDLLARRPEQALAKGQQALSLDPNSADAHHTVGTAMLRLDRGDEAIEHLEAVASLHEDSWRAHAAVGDALARAGRNDAAFRAFRAALALKPDHPPILARVENLSKQRSPRPRKNSKP